MKKFILLYLIAHLLLSCNSDNTMIEEPSCKLQNVDVTFLEPTFGDDSEPLRWIGGGLSNVNFEYGNSGKIEKSIGGFFKLPPATGFDYRVSDEIYDSIVHKSNTIQIFKRHSLPELLPFKDIDISYELNAYGTPIKKTTSLFQFSYKYENGKLIESTRLRHEKDVSVYTYENDNLVKIETILLDSNENPYQRVIHTFEEYDDKENPFRGLFYIRGAFYRSLSKNNYRAYRETYERRNENGEWQEFGYFNSRDDFEYNEESLPKFGEFNCD